MMETKNKFNVAMSVFTIANCKLLLLLSDGADMKFLLLIVGLLICEIASANTVCDTKTRMGREFVPIKIIYSENRVLVFFKGDPNPDVYPVISLQEHKTGKYVNAEIDVNSGGNSWVSGYSLVIVKNKKGTSEIAQWGSYRKDSTHITVFDHNVCQN